MPIFSYKAFDYRGKRTGGLINGFNKRAVLEKLTERGFEVLTIKDKTDTLELKILTLINPVSIKDIVIFSRQFSVMVSANLTLVQSLKISSEQTENLTLKMVIAEISQEVDEGASLSSALAKRPRVFSSFYTNVVKSGETSGKLDEVLTYLADEMEKDYDMNSKIKGAMIYPLFVLFGLLVVGTIMMVVVVPQLVGVLEETGAELPLSTRIVIGISDSLINYWWALTVVMIIIIAVLRTFVRTENGKRTLDALKLKLPVFGKLFRLIFIVRFTRSMHTLIAGGVTVSRSLSIVSKVVGNTTFEEIINESLKEVEEGESLSKSFMRSSEIPKMVPQMITVGEKTGKLDVVLEKITDFYSREISNMLDNLVTLLEPSIMIVMGVAVGIMVAAIIMPMYNLAGQF